MYFSVLLCPLCFLTFRVLFCPHYIYVWNIFKIKYLFKSSCCSSSTTFSCSSPLFELGHSVVGAEDLRVSGAGVAEIVLFVGIVQVASQSRQLSRDLKVPQSLGHQLWIGFKGVYYWRISASHVFLLKSWSWWSWFGPQQVDLGLTFTMWSLGSKLQSAKVSVSPSRYLRVDTDRCGSTSSSSG